LDENTAGELRALLEAATATDHTAPVSENVLLALRRDLGSSAAHLLATDPSGAWSATPTWMPPTRPRRSASWRYTRTPGATASAPRSSPRC
jgi:hypothetical protein